MKNLISKIIRITRWPFLSWKNVFISMFTCIIILAGIIGGILLLETFVLHVPSSQPMFRMPIADDMIPQSPDGLPNALRNGRGGVHEGMDLYAKEDSPVMAAKDGVVIEINELGVKDPKVMPAFLQVAKNGYYEVVRKVLDGKYIVLEHSGGWKTKYCHLGTISVKVGQKVKTGEVIGLSDCTGYCNEPHLHFAVYQPNGEFLGKGYDGLKLQSLLNQYIK